MWRMIKVNWHFRKSEPGPGTSIGGVGLPVKPYGSSFLWWGIHREHTGELALFGMCAAIQKVCVPTLLWWFCSPE